ncbi:hypothetical protein BROUX41_001409 [Berkeleyomyces rouxiae]|uniref:uncharacterized protein n=1 Tax=Berkeleyomyces rouxiae TaxID=2035830 RepID=UPI003B816F9F
MSDETHVVSHGRGGAGNMFPEGPQDVQQPQTAPPVLHEDAIVSTGRGGAGNMVEGEAAVASFKQNEVPSATIQRASLENEPYSQGRGGAGNIVVPEHDHHHTHPAPTDAATPAAAPVSMEAASGAAPSTGIIARIKAKLLKWRRSKAGEKKDL